MTHQQATRAAPPSVGRWCWPDLLPGVQLGVGVGPTGDGGCRRPGWLGEPLPGPKTAPSGISYGTATVAGNGRSPSPGST